jgi:uncharacterized protein (DUF934 family)
MTVFRDGRPVPDDWRVLGLGEAVPPEGRIVLDRAAWLADGPALLARGKAGLILKAGEKFEGLERFIARLPLIILHVGRYADGRHFSTARLLRERHGFGGELRASGDVLRDQITFFLRSGFDTLEISHPGTAAALAAGEIAAVRHFYQPASGRAAERIAGRAWQRLPQGA